jgi:hypothetical protein
MHLLPEHGKMSCRACFSSTHCVEQFENWELLNNPGHWGSRNPEILVLGFSKGLNQAKSFADDDFDDVAFKGFRPRLTQVLTTLGLISESENIDEKLRASETRFAFASLVRCTLSLNSKTSGKLIGKMFRGSPISPAVECTSRFLSELPDHLRLVVMLSTDNIYIEGCKKQISSLHSSSFEVINEVCYRTGRVTWVHAAHPSHTNGWHGRWLDAPVSTTSGNKREKAKQGIALAGLGR